MRRSARTIVVLLAVGIIIGCFSVLIAVKSSHAASNPQLPQPTPQGMQLGESSSIAPVVSNQVCLGCHAQPGLIMKLENGDVLDLTVNPDTYAASIHGQDGYACVQCHTNLGNYPHPAFKATDLRDVTLQLTNVCDRCHSGEYNLTMDSVHAAAQAAGTREAAVCADCHGSHDVHQWTDSKTHEILSSARLSIPTTCAKCHNAIFQKYQASVHGAALTQEGNTDVPTCIDCHGVHNIGNPTTAAFRLKSPALCATCHTDSAIMDKYGISTNVLNTYVADFHGTTVTLFEKQSPDSPTNKPVCYDCHGIHDISRVDDPQTGIQMQQNLLVRCKICHPDASSNFPSAWMSHYIPSPQHFSLVYYVNLFYKIFIPLVLGGMVALVSMDVGHSVWVKARRGKPRPSALKPVDAVNSPQSGQPSQEPLPSPQVVPGESHQEAEQPPRQVELPLENPPTTSEDKPGKEVTHG